MRTDALPKWLSNQVTRLVTLCACLAFAVPASAADNVLQVGIQLEPPNLDPTEGSAAAVDEVVYANVFEGLTGIDADGTVVPRLAERWEISDDGLRYRFFLRSNVRFHDDTIFDAADVVYSLERAAAPASTNAQRSLFTLIDNVTVVDSLTVEINLADPNGAFLQYLAWGDAVMVAPESAANNAMHPVGTGPYRFASWQKGVSILLSRFDAYWGTPVSLDGIRFSIIPDPTAAFAALMSGEVDGFSRYPAPENLAQLREQGRFEVVVGTTEGETLLAINNGLAPFDDLRVRRALNHAIDRQAIIDGAMFGFGEPIGSHFPPHHPAYLDLSSRYAYDPRRARALLAEAGLADGFETVLKLPPSSYARRSGEVIAAQLAAIGVRVRIQNIEWAQWLDQVFTNKEFALTIIAHTEPLDLDIYARSDYYFQYESSAYRQIISALNAASDTAERQTLFQRAQRRLSDDAVNVFLFQLPKTAVWARGISGVWKDDPLQANDFTGVTRENLRASTDVDASNRNAARAGWVLGIGFAIVFVVLIMRAGSVFVVRRVLSIATTLVFATFAIFFLVEVAPGDPASYMMGVNAEPEALAALREELGLSRSLPARYFNWVSGLVSGDLGVSYTYKTPVVELVSERLTVSLPLAVYAVFLAVLLAIPAGLLAARRRGQGADSAVLGVTQIGIALPNFWLAVLLVLLFGIVLRWFPVGGFPGWEAGLLAGLHALTLPALALALPQAAILTRVVRSSLLETLSEDYVRTARAKGLSWPEALRRHAFRNAAIPVLTILGLQFSFLIAGGIIIENVFYLPGLGRLVFQAVTQRDLIVVESVVFVLALATVLISFVVDLAYAAVDPRLRQDA